jgi:Patatin-like phospholipase
MDSPYFASLAQKALQAATTDLSELQGKVGAMLASWGFKLPPPEPHAGKTRDNFQAVLDRALSLPSTHLEGKSSEARKPASRALGTQVHDLNERLDHIEELARTIEGNLGDWGWREQSSYLYGKHEPDKKLETAPKWAEFLGVKQASAPAVHRDVEHALRQQVLNRANDLNRLVDSYAPLMARRLAADLTAQDRVKEIFKKYGFESSAPDHQEQLTAVLAGDALPEKLPQDFKGWPEAAVGGSFAQELATALDYMPSTWALARELTIQGFGNRGNSGNTPPTETPPKDKAWKAGLMGLAFSGGGIRSATFNLGILQGLSQLGLLSKFDYLSTVSGGGYIGSWLISWIKRENIEEVQRRLCPDFTPDPRDLRLEPIRFLRDFSNYLTPQMGLLSADMWVMGVVWVRNTLLNLLILLPAMFSVVLMPRLLELWAGRVADRNLANEQSPHVAYLCILIGLVAWIATLISLNLRQFPATAGDVAAAPPYVRQRFYSRPWGVLTFIVAPILIAAWLASLELWSYIGDFTGWELTKIGLFSAGLVGIFLWNANYLRCFRLGHGKDARHTVLGALAMGVIALTLGVVAALLTVGLRAIFEVWRRAVCCGDTIAARGAVTVVGVPLVVLALFLVLVLLVGFMSRNLPDGASKWLIRVRAYLAIYSTIWLVWTAISIYGPWLDSRIGRLWYAKWPLIAAWAWTTIRGVLAGKSEKTKGGKADWKTSLGFYATVGPYVFILGLFLALAFAANAATSATTDFLTDYLKMHVDSCFLMLFPLPVTLHEYTWAVLFCLVSSAILAFWLSFWFDVNEFSLNTFYRGRLVRCYLGATNKRRRPNPFTGFDPQDDHAALADFKKTAGELKYEGPFPIFNATLNLVHGDELAWQERRGASFTFTPDLCGYETPWHAPANPQPFEKLEFLGYRETTGYAYPAPGMHLGTPVSISGAALSPNMGSYTRAATGFLMTIFNARLGWWLGNPRHKITRHRASPTQGLAYLMKELLGLTNDRAGFIYVSDGGHFENLAIYELVRRRCRFIVASDAEEDAKFAFNGLGNAIRKCREDFGVEIDLRVDLIKPEAASELSRSHCIVGTIRYPDQVGLGYIVYLKASLVGDEPEDVLQYHVAHPDFPHQSTGDQWFTESQFESYRRLGLHIATTAFQRAVEDQRAQLNNPSYRQLLFEELRDNWYPPVPAIQKNFTRHAQALDELVKELRSSNSSLVDLDTLLIPVLGADPPVIAEQDKPKAFLFLSSVIQLMENIYIDLELEANADHPHCAGWIQIFQAWSEKPLFQQAWHRYSWSYGRNFRWFCNRRFGLPYLDVSVMLPDAPPKSGG